MTHIDEDILLKSSLNLLDESEEVKTKIHLAECTICSEKMIDINTDLDFIGSFNPVTEEQQYPSVRNKRKYPFWIKNVAVILFVFGLGYSVIQLSIPEEIVVVKQSLETKSPNISKHQFESCPNIDL